MVRKSEYDFFVSFLIATIAALASEPELTGWSLPLSNLSSSVNCIKFELLGCDGDFFGSIRILWLLALFKLLSSSSFCSSNDDVSSSDEKVV